MGAREQAIRVLAESDVMADLFGWQRIGGPDWTKNEVAALMLDALLAATQEQTCPTCGGDGAICSACMGAGVVPGTEPLIILGPEQVGWQWVDDGIADGGLLSLDSGPWRDTRSVAVYRRAGSPDEEAR